MKGILRGMQFGLRCLRLGLKLGEANKLNLKIMKNVPERL